MHCEDSKDNNQKHSTYASIKLNFFQKLLNSFTCPHNLEKFEKPENSEQSIESWKSRKSKEFIVVCTTSTALSLSFEDLSWESCEEIKEEPESDVSYGYLFRPCFYYHVVDFDC